MYFGRGYRVRPAGLGLVQAPNEVFVDLDVLTSKTALTIAEGRRNSLRATLP
jgi:hypothetical protein